MVHCSQRLESCSTCIKFRDLLSRDRMEIDALMQAKEGIKMNSTMRCFFENLGDFHFSDMCCYCRPHVEKIAHKIIEEFIKNSCENNNNVAHAMNLMKNQEQLKIKALERVAELESIIKAMMKEFKGEEFVS